jgi:predicted O-methyltransferase YrrM
MAACVRRDTSSSPSSEPASRSRRHTGHAGWKGSREWSSGCRRWATFDYVFIDADKTGYPEYYELTIPRLVPGGLLLLDNVLLRGDVLHPTDDRSRIRDELNNRVTGDERVDSVMVFVADGLTLVRKR